MSEHSTENDTCTCDSRRPHYHRKALADVWDEGHAACEWAGLDRDPHVNPYRVISPAMSVREQVVALVADLAQTLSDPTQAWDIAVADFNYDVNRLVKQEET